MQIPSRLCHLNLACKAGTKDKATVSSKFTAIGQQQCLTHSEDPPLGKQFCVTDIDSQQKKRNRLLKKSFSGGTKLQVQPTPPAVKFECIITVTFAPDGDHSTKPQQLQSRTQSDIFNTDTRRAPPGAHCPKSWKRSEASDCTARNQR